jgi:hypothetical protein
MIEPEVHLAERRDALIRTVGELIADLRLRLRPEQGRWGGGAALISTSTGRPFSSRNLMP